MKLESVIGKISKQRNLKGFSYENMANDLQISAAAYRKIETGETKLTLERLFKIADILECSFTDFLDLEKDILNQHNHNNEVVYQQKIDKFYQESKDIFEKLIQSKDDQIQFLKEQIEILKRK